MISMATGVWGCTDIVVGKDASVDGSVITSHTADGLYDARVRTIPGQTFRLEVWPTSSGISAWTKIPSL